MSDTNREVTFESELYANRDLFWVFSFSDLDKKVLVKNPHWEYDTDDDGYSIRIPSHDGWFWEDMKELSRDECDDIEDWLVDAIKDILRG